MPLLDLPRQLRELGRIRMGTTEPYTNKQGQERRRPVKLATWRFTSPSERLLEVAAGEYGGELRVWEEAPGDTKQWELLSDTDVINVVVPPDRSLSQAWELWSQGGCQRRCDGQRESISDSQCLCPADPAERRELAAKIKPEACKPTTRLNLMLPDLDDLGVWRLECHGYYAAVELAGVASLLELATAEGQLVPARLRLEQRTVKRAGEAPKHFGVPALEIAHRLGDFLAPALAATYGTAPQVEAAARPELTGTTQTSAVLADRPGESGPATQAADTPPSEGGRAGEAAPAPGDLPDWLARDLKRLRISQDAAKATLSERFGVLAEGWPGCLAKLAAGDVPAARQLLNERHGTLHARAAAAAEQSGGAS